MGSPAKEGSLARTEMVGPVPLHTYGDGWMIDALPSASKRAASMACVQCSATRTPPASATSPTTLPNFWLARQRRPAKVNACSAASAWYGRRQPKTAFPLPRAYVLE